MQTKELSPFLIRKSATVVEALQKIDKNSKGLLFIAGEANRLEGVITDGDVRRWLIKTGDLSGKVEEFMNSSPLLVHQNDLKDAIRIMQEEKVTAIPVVDESGALVDIVFHDMAEQPALKMSSALTSVPVVIMAGGKGTRLYPYTKILPKPLIPIGDIPIMERIIEKFRQFGVNDYYATVNYRKNMIRSYFSDQTKGYELNYVEEDQPLGTAGSLKLIEKEFDVPFFVTNCDILIHADYEDIYRYHKESGNEITVVSALKNIVVPYGVLKTSENGIVEKMEEKPKLSYFVNSGMYILNSEVVEDIPENTFFHMTDLIDKLLASKRQVGMYPVSEDSFLDMGEFEEMHRMEQKLNLKTE